MPLPRVIYSAAPDKVSDGSLGWLNRTLFSFQSAGGTRVPNGEDVFQSIRSDGYNYKGSNILPINYFRSPNVNSGKSLKITMYFGIQQYGEGINIHTGLKDITNDVDYLISPYSIGYVSDGKDLSYCKYESYISTFISYDSSNPGCFLQATGNITFPVNPNNTTRTTTINNIIEIADYTTNELSYRPILINRCDGRDLSVVSLMLEEIG